MARIATTLDKILLKVIDRMIEVVDSANPGNTYLSLQHEMDTPPSSSDVLYEISPAMTFRFEPGEFAGGGHHTLHTTTHILVTPHIIIDADPTGKDTLFLTHATRGACMRITDVLRALTEYDPENDDGDQILAEPMRPLEGQIPPKRDRTSGLVDIAFEVQFDWDISPAPADLSTPDYE